MPKFIVSSVCSAFNTTTIGTKIVDFESFMAVLGEGVEAHDHSKDEFPGHSPVVLPNGIPYVSAGVGERSRNEGDFVIRTHRGTVGLFMKREKASPVESLVVIIYSREAYLSDPQVEFDEVERVARSGADHVVVAVLAGAGPRPQLTPYRFVANLAGGNKEAATYTADKIREMAVAIMVYDDKYCVVAD